MIKVTDKYFISVSDCYVVYEKSIIQSGKNEGAEKFNNPTYHYDMTDALTYCIRRIQMDNLNGDEVIELKEAAKILIDTQKEFTELVRGICEVQE